MIRTLFFQGNPFSYKRKERAFTYKPYVQPIYNLIKTTFDHGDNRDKDKDDDELKKRTNKKKLQRINDLNHIFYNVTDITGREIYELIYDKMKAPLVMKLENRKNRIYLVIYPESSLDTKEYIRELDKIARYINESSSKYFVRQVLRDLKLIEKNLLQEIIIPLDIYSIDE